MMVMVNGVAHLKIVYQKCKIYFQLHCQQSGQVVELLVIYENNSKTILPRGDCTTLTLA